ncbi:ECF transporter S component [Tetragenococcus koreensis]|uniref:ECF transporter S component n=1 Tax=Tetragenococcus koreensis TaxID=290335 RepID=A0AAN4UDE1_9ENTE|nr:ECF transporter S component [Tetragenococcus koreensis]AYW45115.1 ECF transporter S component [Tetragenococcus koreensis]MCF1584314.1 ECF transporter S component [Tetragenococcus koreensis]MCF1613863.1 ECF transporter S component [Tetragenococcus koreensis]MCF1616055.1 ECF transporter S component [Tetragenococcus koreensis]MCF1618593.1 ECF transporter S component [Tetragenococcus koreensis]
MKQNHSFSFFSTYELAYLAMTVATCTVGRLLFQFLPNIQPMTAIFLIITLQLGIFRGLIINILSVLITNMYLGMGVWTISQIISFGIIICLMGFLCRLTTFRNNRLLQAAFSVFAGFLYGFVIAFIDVKVYGMPQFWPYYISGLSFDLLHAIGNGGFYLILSPIFQRLFIKTVKKKA